MTRKFRGTSLDDIQGMSDYNLFSEAANNLLSKIDPLETIRHGEVDVFDGIYDYTSPTDLKGKKILDIRPQVNRLVTDNVSQSYIEDFDRDKEDQKFSVEFDEGSKFIRYKNNVGNSITVDDVEDTDWTGAGGASNVEVDTILYSEASASLRFDIGATGGYVENTSLTSVDLSDHENKSTLYRWVYFPDSTIISSVALRIGSSSSNYFTITGAIAFGSIKNGWNLYKFEWNGATETGTTVTTAMVYERLTIVSTALDTDIRIGRLESKLPVPSEFVYYSNALFRPASGATWLTTPTDDTDIVNLESEAENIFINECCVLIADDLQQYDDMRKFMQKLGIRDDGTLTGEGLYGDYKRNKPSEAIKPQSTYYKVNRIRK